MLCVVLSVTNQISNIGSFLPYRRSLGCHNSICEPVFSLSNADASYRCHYGILAFTVSIVLINVSGSIQAQKWGRQGKDTYIFKDFIADQTLIYNLCLARAESCV